MLTLLHLQNLIWGMLIELRLLSVEKRELREKRPEKVIPLIMQVLPGNLKEE